jgi:release factor glutamine methyltransferase
MPSDRLGTLLADAAARLKAAGCETPGLDARLLLQHAAGLTREDLILDPDRLAGPDAARRFRQFVDERLARKPVARILGEREFYGRAFRVTPDVLDPRPDTETLVAAALALMPEPARILDLGTGSGAILITLLAERTASTGVAVDVSAAALAVARTNAGRHGLEDRAVFLHGSWFEPVTGHFDVIVANPPYIPAADIGGLAPDVRLYDPPLALDGGPDGFSPYRAIVAGAPGHLAPGGHVLVEIGAGQADDVERIFAASRFRGAGRYRDLAGHVRCLAFAR